MIKKALVIGSGIGGLATGLRLNHAGWDVTILESSGVPGGKINTFHREGFRFDTGPSLFTLPHLVEELFLLYGEDPQKHIPFFRLSNITRYFYADGMRINAWQDPERMAHEVEQQTGESGSHVLRYLEDARTLYELTANTFIFNPFSFSRIFSKDALRAAVNLHRLNAFKSMHQVNKRYFSHPAIVQLFDRYATYNGSNPYKAPGTLCVIAHLEHNMGAYFPKQGMHQIVQSLYDFSKQKGVSYSFNDPAEEILLKGGSVCGVRSRSGTHEASVVVSNADVFSTWNHLLPRNRIPSRLTVQQRSSSALIFYWGVKGTHPSLDLHNILFSSNYREEFDYLFAKKRLYFDPTVYIFISSRAVPGDAPSGCENWFVMINVPSGNTSSWDGEQIERARGYILSRVERVTGISLSSSILFEEVLHPGLLESRTGTLDGALYGNSSNSPYSAFLRQPNRSAVKGLYFTGGTVHPGGGIPLCLASAAITSNSIIKKYPS